MKYEYTEELDNILLKYGRVDDIANEGFDLLRDWKVGEIIDTESDFDRLAKLQNKDGDYIAIFPECVYFGNEDCMGTCDQVSTEIILAIGKLCVEVDKCVASIEKETTNERYNENQN